MAPLPASEGRRKPASGSKRLRGGGHASHATAPAGIQPQPPSPAPAAEALAASVGSPPKRPRRTAHGAAAAAAAAVKAEAPGHAVVSLTPPSTPEKQAALSGSKGKGKGKSKGSHRGGSSSKATAQQPKPKSSPQPPRRRLLLPPLPPAPPVRHTGMAAAHIVARWLAAAVGEAPARPDVECNPLPGEKGKGRGKPGAEEEEMDVLVRGVGALGALLGAVGGRYHWAAEHLGEEEEEEEGITVVIGDPGMVLAKLVRFLLDRRERVAEAAGRALLGLVAAAAPRRALGYLLGEEALALVCRKLGDYRPEWRLWALELLLNALPSDAQARLLSASQRAAVVGMLADPNREVRHMAAGVLGSGGERESTAELFLGEATEKHVKAVVELLNETRLAMRAAGVQMLARLPLATQPTITTLLPPKLASPVRGTRLFALEALRCGLPTPLGQDPATQRACLRLVLRRIADPAQAVRKAAGGVLATLPFPVLAEYGIVERLLAQAQQQGGGTRRNGESVFTPPEERCAARAAAALEAVARLPPTLLPPHAPELCALLEDSTHPDVRKAALEALGRLSSLSLAPFIVPYILPRLSHATEPNPHVRRAAITALQDHDIDATFPLLTDLAHVLETDPSDSCRAACAATLASLHPPTDTIAPFAPTLLRRLLASDEAPPAQLAALQALACLPPPSLMQNDLLETLVAEGATHEAAAIREATLRLLVSLPLDAGVGPFLDTILPLVEQRTETYAFVRRAALDALVGVPPQLLTPSVVGIVRGVVRGDSDGAVREAAGRVVRSWGVGEEGVKGGRGVGGMVL